MEPVRKVGLCLLAVIARHPEPEGRSPSKGEQKFTKLEGGQPDVLKTSFSDRPFEEPGLSTVDAITFTGPTKVKG